MNKIGELSHRIFSFNKAGHRDIAMSPPSALAKSIAALRFKILNRSAAMLQIQLRLILNYNLTPILVCFFLQPSFVFVPTGKGIIKVGIIKQV